MKFFPCNQWTGNPLSRILLLMKLSVILTFILFFQVSAKSLGQLVTLQVSNKDLTSVLKSIKAQTGLSYIIYGSNLAKVKVNLDVRNQSISEVMNAIKLEESLDWIIRENVIIIRNPVAVETTSSVSREVQQISLRGRITDRHSTAIANITVHSDTFDKSTKTDENGEFNLSIPSARGNLIFSGVGFQRKSVPIGEETSLDIVLESQVSDLDEVVIVGYGQFRKGDLTGSIATVKMNELATFPSSKITQALVGRTAGVNITQNSGAPNSRMQIRIRGTNSIFGSNEPLWIIDGFPGNQDMVNSSDVEQIEILKDASATAIYGSRGANGVVIVTTKKGSSGTTKVELNSSHSLQRIRKKLDLMNAEEYAQLYNVYWNNIQGSDYFTPDQIKGFGEGTDWQDEIMRIGNLTDHTLNFIGGNDKTRFSVGGSLLQNNGIIKNSGFGRKNIRGNIQNKLNNYVDISANILYSQIDENPTADNSIMIHGALAAAPTVGPYDEFGEYTMLGELYPFSPTDIVNPVAYLNERNIENLTKSF